MRVCRIRLPTLLPIRIPPQGVYAQHSLFLFCSTFCAAAATFAKHAETQMPAGGYVAMMDLQEATACLDEHRIALANICRMLKPVVAEGGLGEAMGKLNQKLIEKLNDE